NSSGDVQLSAAGNIVVAGNTTTAARLLLSSGIGGNGQITRTSGTLSGEEIILRSCSVSTNGIGTASAAIYTHTPVIDASSAGIVNIYNTGALSIAQLTAPTSAIVSATGAVSQ